MPGLDLISPKLLPDLVRTSLAVMVTLHTGIIMMRRSMSACTGTHSVHSPPPVHTAHTSQHVHKNIPPAHSMDRYGPACHVDRHSQCPPVSTCPPAQAACGTAGGCRGCGGGRGGQRRQTWTQQFALTSAFWYLLSHSINNLVFT